MSFWLKRALKRATARPSPDRIPFSAPRVFYRNYYSVTLSAPDASWSFLFSRLDGDTVHGRWLEGDRYAEEISTVPLPHFSNAAIDIRYYLRQYEFLSRSARRFEMASLARLYQMKAALGGLRQRLYNRKSLVLQDRHKLLRTLVEKAIDDRDARFSDVTLVADIYGRMVVNHPLFRSRVARYRMILESLAADELLTRTDGGYRLEPNAIGVLNAYDDEERRHADNVKMQWRMMWVAVFSGIAAFAQAWPTLKPFLASLWGHLQKLG
ncbi:conserved hypothetical protein [Cupriavidus taiwanensis]|uniref:Uncharacterized protein n=1 Tax=Cupriavidus taiwanensis TaxID=164546 RepID=A0A976G0B3_9BURK|nr:hypothetical protein [Cupriavidus taiwanensis]SOZ49323.1 conserved hypothetical protein [Cupriavidus taiwanensis]SOZ49386.1 conserved hypothetical protein [Cupriavidus taiwanensis]SOZ51986.1 conserved hypothetical protein [Cupriavidus taiwanensis]SPA07159.1 conserved hypothetical protein [Cupriavidus taiwanensis]